MAKQAKKEFTLTASGYEYDKELSKLSVKVFPALQALIANQHELMEICPLGPENAAFLDAHLAELVEVEETIAREYTKDCAKREEIKKKRKDKAEALKKMSQLAEKDALVAAEEAALPNEYDERLKDSETLLDEMVDRFSPGLPSAGLTVAPKPAAAKTEAIDVRRIAVGASIKALSALLKRELNEQELALIENQIDEFFDVGNANTMPTG